MRLDECGLRFMAGDADGAALRAQWGWTGPVVGIEKNTTSQISYEGCLAVCGHGIWWHNWDAVSAKLTTWILPVIGILLQAPFGSNAFGKTCLDIARWTGSPIASLSYILWNIKVNAKCALMVDMACEFEDRPGRKTDFGSMRDSMYLLTVMNQYTIKPQSAIQKESEGLLRIALFCKDLHLVHETQTLRTKRRKLARELREIKIGAVPVFISTLWFVFAFALSIQQSFGNLGGNTTAHDLALGQVLSWFPILVLCSVVDRNPIASEAIRKKLNDFVKHVGVSIQDPLHRRAFTETFRDQPEFDRMRLWLDQIARHCEYLDHLFVDFVGQGRVRFHYGPSHPILSDIENCYVAERGRNWLANEKEARTNLVLGPVDEGLVRFDIRELLWPRVSALLIVSGAVYGGFIVSFFTPTVGLSCRSGGYVIFFSIALGLMVVEMTVWWLFNSVEWMPKSRWVTRTYSRLHHNANFNHMEEATRLGWTYLKRRSSGLVFSLEGLSIRIARSFARSILRHKQLELPDRIELVLRTAFHKFHCLSLQRRIEIFFFRPIEAVNSAWLIYLVVAQTFGSYRTCYCLTSSWGGQGGYLDFTQQDSRTSKWTLHYWVTGTLICAVIMTISMFYIMSEYMQQSWLSTDSYEDAMYSLKLIRRYKQYTFWLRSITRFVLKFTIQPLHTALRALGFFHKTQKSLLWTKEITWNPPLCKSSPISSHNSHEQLLFPAIELTDCSFPQATSHDQQYDNTTILLPPTSYPMIRPRRSLSVNSAHPILAPTSPIASRARSLTDVSTRASVFGTQPPLLPTFSFSPYHPAHRDLHASNLGSPLLRPPVAHTQASGTDPGHRTQDGRHGECDFG